MEWSTWTAIVVLSPADDALTWNAITISPPTSAHIPQRPSALKHGTAPQVWGEPGRSRRDMRGDAYILAQTGHYWRPNARAGGLAHRRSTRHRKAATPCPARRYARRARGAGPRPVCSHKADDAHRAGPLNPLRLVLPRLMGYSRMFITALGATWFRRG